MKIREKLYIIANLSALLFLSSCSQNFASKNGSVPSDFGAAPLSEDLVEHLGKVMTYEVWGCKTVTTSIGGADRTFPYKDCGDFATSKNRLPRKGEPGFANTEKIGEIRVKIEGDEKGITDVLFGIDDAFAQASLYNAVFRPIVEDLANGKRLETQNMHSLKKALSESARSNFELSPQGNSFSVTRTVFETSNAGGVSNVDLKMTFSSSLKQWLRFSFETKGSAPKFSASVQMKALDPNTYTNDADVKGSIAFQIAASLALDDIDKAGGSKAVGLKGMSVTLLPGVTKTHNESLLADYASIGGPEFRFASSN